MCFFYSHPIFPSCLENATSPLYSTYQVPVKNSGPVKLPKEEDRRKCEGDPISWWDGSVSRLCLLETRPIGCEAPRDGKLNPHGKMGWIYRSLTAESTGLSEPSTALVFWRSKNHGIFLGAEITTFNFPSAESCRTAPKKSCGDVHVGQGERSWSCLHLFFRYKRFVC